MQNTARQTKRYDPDKELYLSLEPVIRGLGMALIELSVFRGKGRGEKPGSVQVRVVTLAKGVTGLDDCSRVHRGIMPRLEQAFPDRDIYLEVSSPGINRTIKDISEFAHYTGREIKCYRTDISDWTAGILLAADEQKLVFKGDEGEFELPFEIIAKAQLI